MKIILEFLILAGLALIFYEEVLPKKCYERVPFQVGTENNGISGTYRGKQIECEKGAN